MVSMNNSEADKMMASRSGEPLRSIATTWLLLGVSYIPWTVAIARQALHGSTFTVSTWTLVSPFAIVGMAPLGAILVFWNKRVAGGVVLALLAVNALASQGILGIILSFKQGHPFTVLQVLLSFASVFIIAAEVFQPPVRAFRPAQS